ncbi:hypothetical protein TREMEDRAFT_62408 [Tremella mesenterica DSM 1558]|uniref:uncharacterized protein n=1 Tax=Tremella mesenterica (strain ATCC 24925 / CBS 8224 / DSM 1558 / NBRC 9311 / NRRL Y-6157 / RJB 2259-6 / UBC 559-6) TaxID=578456 RepID=UPI0003F49F6E|nr:uncharacterized protein TREMEDRAFT_62408 [Tremella mesenterica DSM 1558]EIW69548.1 hypothetical protein TREMEDRAFT_62408 [Tremella mesenterica DSM 1558]
MNPESFHQVDDTPVDCKHGILYPFLVSRGLQELANALTALPEDGGGMYTVAGLPMGSEYTTISKIPEALQESDRIEFGTPGPDNSGRVRSLYSFACSGHVYKTVDDVPGSDGSQHTAVHVWAGVLQYIPSLAHVGEGEHHSWEATIAITEAPLSKNVIWSFFAKDSSSGLNYVATLTKRGSVYCRQTNLHTNTLSSLKKGGTAMPNAAGQVSTCVVVLAVTSNTLSSMGIQFKTGSGCELSEIFTRVDNVVTEPATTSVEARTPM